MQIGQLNKQIVLYSVSQTTLASGQKQETFAEEITLFANYMPAGSETYQAGQKVALKSDTFITHNIITNPDTRKRLSYNGNMYEIESIIPIENDFFQEIKTVARDNENPDL